MEDNFELRSYQGEIISFITESLKGNIGVAIESPTGSGKTLMGLQGALKYATENGKKILYLTRTNSQQEQVIRELRRIATNLKIHAMPMQGRHNLCLLYREVEGHQDFSSESLSRFCRLRKKKVLEGDPDACRYYNYDVWSEETKNYIFSTIPFAEEFLEYGSNNIICPYESLKRALPEADIVLAPYASFLNPAIGERFLQHWGVSRDDLVLILDEAHNLPDLARDMSSFDISIRSINYAENEARDQGDFLLYQKYKSSDVLEMTRSAIISLVNEKIGESDEVRISFHDLIETIMVQNRISSQLFHDLVNYMELFGESIAEKREREGKVPRSSVMSVAIALMKWEMINEDTYVAILSRNGEGSVSAFCLDPSQLLSPLQQSKSIHMSGTLSPIGVYLDIIGFSGIPHKKISEIFPAERRKVIYYNGVTTKFDAFNDEEASKMHNLIEDIISRTNKGTIVFFPSYSAMKKVFGGGFSFPVLMEERELSQADVFALVGKFRKTRRPLLAVSGGRLSEGLNFPGNQLEVVIVAGIPYPRPDAKNRALHDYYEARNGKGWEYSVKYPTSVKIRQEIGRLIRSSSDIGIAIILDKRASYFRKEIPGMTLAENPAAESEDFFLRFSEETNNGEP